MMRVSLSSTSAEWTPVENIGALTVKVRSTLVRLVNGSRESLFEIHGCKTERLLRFDWFFGVLVTC